jgi:small subunit ribosomal protein S17
MVAKEKIGIVVSDKMTNTIIVAVNNRVSHKRYKKVITRIKRYVVHDDQVNAKIGDKVKIQEVKPISKTKNWVTLNIIEKTST